MDPNAENYLIFILGAEEEKQGMESCGLNIRKADEPLARKRIEQYLQGGIFAPTSKTLTLDLLSKKLSPSIITGIIIMNPEKTLKGSHAQGDDTFMSNICFCLKLFRRDNKDGFIKVISSNPNGLRFKHKDIKDFMVASYCDKLILYPRIRKEVKNSLDMGVNLNMKETEIKMDPKMEELQKIIIDLIHICIEILQKELNKYDLPDEIFSMENVLTGSFHGKLKYELK